MLDTLPRDALEAVLGKLEWRDLLSAVSACHTLRDAGQPAWLAQCRRFSPGGLNAHLFPPSPPAPPGSNSPPPRHRTADFKALFLHDNGWGPGLGLELRRWAGCRWADELVAVQPDEADDGATLVAVSTCRELRVLQLGPEPTAQLQTQRAGMHGAGGPSTELWSSVAALPGGLVAAGSCHGRLALFCLPEHGSACCSQARVQPTAALALPGNRWVCAACVRPAEGSMRCLLCTPAQPPAPSPLAPPPIPPLHRSIVSQLRYLPRAQLLAALADPLALLRPVPQRGGLVLVDAATWQELAPGGLRDVLDGFELAAAVPVGAGGAEFVAGSVKLSGGRAACLEAP